MKSSQPLCVSLLVSLILAWSCNAQGQRADDLEASQAAAAETASAKKKYQAVIDSLKDVSSQNPVNIQTLLALSEAYMVFGDFDNAARTAQAALEVGGPSDTALDLLGRTSYSRGRYEEAEGFLKRAVSVNARNASAHFNLGRLLEDTGRKPEARNAFQSSLALYESGRANSARDLLAAALSAKHLERFGDANRIFQEASRFPDGSLEVFVAWGNLFLEKYNRKDATQTFEDALEIDSHYPPALVGLADALSETRTSFAEAKARQSLEINPTLAEARHLLARLYLDDEQYSAAIEQLELALDVNPNDPLTRSYLAACYNAMGRYYEFETETRRVLEINPEYGRLYSVVADNLSRRYRFVEAIEMGRKAIELNPRLWSAYSSLGVNLSRVGKEEEAREYLNRAFDGDSYNVWTLNTLNLFDSIDKYAVHRSENFVLKLDSAEDPIYGKLAIDLLEQAHRTISPRYGFTPTRPILVEIFPDHDDFAVRISGLPGAGALLGVCFGEVIVADSPRARPAGSFNWGQTLWHEFAHVVHLQMTRNRIPRWLAEGIAVYEARIARPEWDIDLSIEFAHATERDELLKISDLNSGFTRPKSAEQVIMSYYQASITVEYIVEEYGFEAVRKMLRLYNEEKSTEMVIKETFGVDFDSFDEGFAAYADGITRDTRSAIRFSAENGNELSEGDLRAEVATNPGSFYAHLYLGRLLMSQSENAEAIEMLERAKALLPLYTHPGNPYELLVEIHGRTGNVDGQIIELEALTDIDEDGIDVCKTLAGIYEERNLDGPLIPVLVKATMINPFDSSVRNTLGRAYERQRQFRSAITEFKAALEIETTDLAGAHFNLARVYLASGDRLNAKTSALAALKIAPNFEAAQEILLDAME